MSDPLRTLVRGTGQLLITAGLVLLLFVGYELWFTTLYTSAQQGRLGEQLERAWAVPAAVPAEASLGSGVARIHAPRLGSGFTRVVVEGTRVEDLKRGPGHYAGTALPGQPGNTAIAGHRTTYGAPFHRLDELRRGDAVVLETASSWFTYAVRDQEVVLPSDVAVTLPVPRRPGAAPTERLLTLTTCHPTYSARQRLVVVAVLTESRPKSAGPPRALSGDRAGGGA